MAGYADTKKLIEDTLVGRPAGTMIYPEGHQAIDMSLLDYIHSVELLGASELQGIATTSTVPVQPDNAKVSYIATVPAGQTYVFTNFHDQNGNSISITTGANTVSLLTFLWNGEYWQVQNSQIQLMLNITAGYLYAGIAIPSTNPGSPDEPVFYIAAQAGTYANFGGIVVNEGEAAILKYVNSSWVKEVSGLATREEVSRLGQDVNAYPDLFGMKRTSNLFDFRNAKNHIRVTKTDGTPFNTDNGWSTDYIDVTGLEHIYMNYLCEYAVFYDANKEFLSTDNRILYNYPVPSNAKYVILNFVDDRTPYSFATSLMLSENSIEEIESYYSEFTKGHPLISDYRTVAGDNCLLVCDRPIDINFLTNKIIFPNSTNIFLYYRREKYDIPANTVINLDLSFGSGYITFDVINKTFASRRYGRATKEYITENEIFVFAISNYNVVLDCPHTINGTPNTDTTIYEEKSGIIDYDNTWWKVGTSNYKYIVIPIVGNNAKISVTSIRANTYMMGLKSYVEPIANGPIANISDVWVRRIEIPNGETLEASVPSDVKYIVLNVLYNNEPCISGLSVGADNAETALHTITIATQNVRDFSDGSGDGCPTGLVQTNLPLWKEQFSKFLNADFLTLVEWYPYFDRDMTINAYETLLQQFFPYKYELPSVNPTRIILSKYPGILTDLKSFGPSMGFNMPMIVCNIHGYKVAVVCWLQSSSDPASTRIAAYNSAITVLSGFDKVILAGDFNTEQGLSELQVWKDAGYTLGNGGYWGEINTWEDRTPNDNIVTKGFIFENFEKGERVSSDHNAVRATLRFLTAK